MIVGEGGSDGGSSLEDGPEGGWKWGLAALGGRRGVCRHLKLL